MKFVSTRNNSEQVSFSQAILQSLAPDGGLYVPAYGENLSPWIMYMDENTSFQSIAGSLTAALIKEEFSPIISEAIASQAFPFSPVLQKLENDLYVLELFHGPTGTHKDFGVSYLAACLEHILLMKEKQAIIFSATEGETGASVTCALRGKKHIKAVLLYAKGTARGFTDEDCVWNGGNIYPVEFDGDMKACHAFVRNVYRQAETVKKYSLTPANTVNIGRLLPHTFLYMYAFSRLKKHVTGDLYYAMPANNYGNLAAGLYSWKFSLPVNGFITNCTPSLSLDAKGKCSVLDSIVPLHERSHADPVKPSSIERLEEIFATSPAVMKTLIFPAFTEDEELAEAAQHLFVKYGRFFDPGTVRAYVAAQKTNAFNAEAGSVVTLVSCNEPALSPETIRLWCAEKPAMPERLKAVYAPQTNIKRIQGNIEEIEKICAELI
ncbi:MAG: threonine synthase [Spirochaetales bacterium]